MTAGAPRDYTTPRRKPPGSTISIKDKYGHSRNTPEPACRYGESQ
jgi:hypothetical protein